MNNAPNDLFGSGDAFVPHGHLGKEDSAGFAVHTLCCEGLCNQHGFQPARHCACDITRCASSLVRPPSRLHFSSFLTHCAVQEETKKLNKKLWEALEAKDPSGKRALP